MRTYLPPTVFFEKTNSQNRASHHQIFEPSALINQLMKLLEHLAVMDDRPRDKLREKGNKQAVFKKAMRL